MHMGAVDFDRTTPSGAAAHGACPGMTCFAGCFARGFWRVWVAGVNYLVGALKGRARPTLLDAAPE